MAKIITDDQHYINIANAIRESNDETTLYKPSEMADAVRNLSSLNFKIVGGTVEPSNPAENTIWINTSEEITSWVFSAEEPEAPEEGMVWFVTGTESSLPFNALKENRLQVYPSLAKQYNGDTFVSADAFIYQDSEWKSYYDGVICMSDNEFEHITGGWVAAATFTPWDEASVAIAPTVTKDDDSITLAMSVSHAGSFHTNNKVDVSKYTSLNIDVTSASCTNGYLMLFLMASKGNNMVSNAAAFTILLGNGVTNCKGTRSIDLGSKNITGEYYIGLSYRTYDTYSMTADFTKIYLK